MKRSSGLLDEAFSKIDMDVDCPLSLSQETARANTYTVNESVLDPKSTKAESLAKRQTDYRTMKKAELLGSGRPASYWLRGVAD